MARRPTLKALRARRRRGGAAEAPRDAAREELATRIEALSPGDRLPAEPELAAELDVSRATLRDALRSFEERGVLTRTPGVGTVRTRRPRLSNDLSVNSGVTELIRDHGMAPGTREVEVRRERAFAEEARLLGLERRSPVWVIDRVRTADGRPVIFSRDVVPERVLGQGDRSIATLGEGSLYSYLSDKGHEVRQGVASITPESADASLARRLGVRRGMPLLRLVQVDYDASGEPVLLSHEHHVPDAFEVTVVRRTI